jgi:hypothetical protein
MAPDASSLDQQLQSQGAIAIVKDSTAGNRSIDRGVELVRVACRTPLRLLPSAAALQRL